MYKADSHTDDSFERLRRLIFPIDSVGDDIVCTQIRLSSSNASSAIFKEPLKVRHLTPLGLELTSPSILPIPLTSQVLVLLDVEGIEREYEGVLVGQMQDQVGNYLLGIRFSKRKRPEFTGQERRAHSRWMCPERYSPTCVVANPMKFNEFLYFGIRNISVNGLQLFTNDRNRFIVEGMRFDGLINLPMISQLKVSMIVRNAYMMTERSKRLLIVGVELVGLKNRHKDALGHYLLQFGEIETVKDLQESGFFLKKNERLNWAFVRSIESYYQVIAFRKQFGKSSVHHNVGSSTSCSNSFTMMEDTRSRILICQLDSKMLATARINLNDSETPFEFERNIMITEEMPRRDEIIEIVDAIYDPSLNRQMLLCSMIKFIACVAAHSRRRWIAISTLDSDHPIYESLGFSPLHAARRLYSVDEQGNPCPRTMMADLHSIAIGINVDAFVWNHVYKESFTYFYCEDLFDADPLMHVRLGLYRIFYPFHWVKRAINYAAEMGKGSKSRRVNQ